MKTLKINVICFFALSGTGLLEKFKSHMRQAFHGCWDSVAVLLAPCPRPLGFQLSPEICFLQIPKLCTLRALFSLWNSSAHRGQARTTLEVNAPGSRSHSLIDGMMWVQGHLFLALGGHNVSVVYTLPGGPAPH